MSKQKKKECNHIFCIECGSENIANIKENEESFPPPFEFEKQYAEGGIMKKYSIGDKMPGIDKKQYQCIDNDTASGKVTNKYTRTIIGKDKEGEYVSVEVDVYDVLDAFPVKCPALQHLTKKSLFVGMRGHKNQGEDLDDIIKSAIRAKELYESKKG